MRGALMDEIMRSTVYRCWDYHRLPETISDLRSSGRLHLIQNMTLNLSKLSNWGSVKRFPEILGLVCGEMPALVHLYLFIHHGEIQETLRVAVSLNHSSNDSWWCVWVLENPPEGIEMARFREDVSEKDLSENPFIYTKLLGWSHSSTPDPILWMNNEPG